MILLTRGFKLFLKIFGEPVYNSYKLVADVILVAFAPVNEM